MKLRTKYLINPRLQLSILGVAFGLSLISCFVIYAFFVSYFHNMQIALSSAGIKPGSPLFEYMLIQKSKLESALFWIGAVVIFLNTVILTVVTHRIAGPVYRIHKSIEALLAGRAKSKFRLRKGDYFSETAELLEQVRLRGLKEIEKEKKAG